MATAADIHSILFKGDILKQPEPRYDPSRKVKRYFRGKVPHFTSEYDTHLHEDFNPEFAEEFELNNVNEDTNKDKISNTTQLSHQDKRLEFLENIKKNKNFEERKELNNIETHTRKKRHREVLETQKLDKREYETNHDVLRYQYPVDKDNTKENQVFSKPIQKRVPVAPQVLSATNVELDSTLSKDHISNNSVNDVDWSRVRLKSLKTREQEEQDLLINQVEFESILEEDDTHALVNAIVNQSDEFTESDNDTDDEEFQKPIFIASAKKNIMDSIVQEEARKQKILEEENERKRNESKDLLIKSIIEENEDEKAKMLKLKKGSWEPDELINDDDTIDEKEQYEAWKIRVVKRYIRNREEKLAQIKLAAKIEQRRYMTEEERKKDDEKLDSLKPKPEERTKYKFMQKYYHKGVFFQDKTDSGEEKLFLRNYNVPVGEDTVDKYNLPKPLRIRRGLFGKAGQVKHTHLADVDTTDFNSAWSKNINTNKTHLKITANKGANEFERPTKKK